MKTAKDKRLNFIWAHKYRPERIEDCILPSDIEAELRGYVETKQIPDLLFTGAPGIGKTTAAKAMVEQIGSEWLFIKGSMENNIDTLRNKISQFASSYSLTSDENVKKYVVIDEADYLNAQSTQPALRNFMDSVSDVCGFIFTCNYPNKLIPPLLSRFTVVNFRLKREERQRIAGLFYKRAAEILVAEEIEFDQKVLATLILRHAPDWRKTLLELQRLSRRTGKLVSLNDTDDETFNALIAQLKNKNFTGVRRWIAETPVEPEDFFRQFYDKAELIMKDQHSMASLIIALGDFQDRATRVADPEINMAAFMATIMKECELK